MNEFEKLVLKMRTAQKNYFRTRDPRYLQESKQAERAVDGQLATAEESQGDLFGSGATGDALNKRIEELEAAINRACSCCWAKDAPDAAQCRLCGLKNALKGANP